MKINNKLIGIPGNYTHLKRQGKEIFIFMVFISAILMLNFASAQSPSLGTVRQGECVNLVQSCSSCTTNVISTVLYPNSSVAVSTLTMSTTDSIYYNYTFCNTTTLGQYIVNGYGDVDGIDTNWVYDFWVTPNGTITSSSQGLLSIGVLFSIVLLMIFFGWLAFRFIEKDSTFAIGLFFLVMSLILSLYSLFLGYVLSRDYLFTSISSVQEGVFISALLGLTGIMFIGFVFLIIAVIKEALMKRTMQKYGEGYNTKTKTYDY